MSLKVEAGQESSMRWAADQDRRCELAHSEASSYVDLGMAMMHDDSSDPRNANLSNQVLESKVYSRSKQAVSNTLMVTKGVLYFTGVAAWQAGSSLLAAVQNARGTGKQDSDVARLENVV